MVALRGTGGVTRAAEHDEFLALVCADEEWLRAEFDAIVAAEWPGPPPGAAGGRCDRERPRDPRIGRRARFTAPSGTSGHSRIGARRRQRSPPACRGPNVSRQKGR
jgi:hypothetical protein